MKNISAAILAGGLGTRLSSVLRGTPKVLARVGKRPFVAILLDRLECAGIEEVVFLTGFQAEQVRQAFGHRFGSMTLKYSVEARPLGTAGALRLALPHFELDRLLLLNGDSFCDVDLPSLVAEHLRTNAEMSLTLTHVSEAGRFGRVETAPDGRVTRFAEKEESGSAGWINAGISVLERSLLEEIPRDRAVSLERQMMPIWVQGRRLFGFRTTGRFLDIGTPESYAQASAFLSAASGEGRMLENNTA